MSLEVKIQQTTYAWCFQMWNCKNEGTNDVFRCGNASSNARLQNLKAKKWQERYSWCVWKLKTTTKLQLIHLKVKRQWWFRGENATGNVQRKYFGVKMQQIFEINIFRERNAKSRATLMDLEVKMEQVSLQLKDSEITIR